MFFYLLFISILLLIIYETLGSLIKKILKIEFPYFNFIIGYLFSVCLFYFFHVYFILNQYSYRFLYTTVFPIYIGFLLLFVLLSLRRQTLKIDYLVVVFSFIFITYFFSYTFITPEESTKYLSDIHHAMMHPVRLNIFQSYTLLFASLFHINTTVFTINVMTFIHLYIILYTIYECMRLFIGARNKSRFAFLFFILFFLVVNTTLKTIIIPMNAYDFIYHPYSGKAIYLYAMIPLQFALFTKLNRQDYLLFLLINLSAMAFTSISIYMQLILNLAFILTILIKSHIDRSELLTFTLITLLPLLMHLIIYTVEPRFTLIYGILYLSIIFLIVIISYHQKNHLNSRLFLTLSILFIAISLILSLYIFNQIYQNISDTYIQDIKSDYAQEKNQVMIFYLLAIYALFKLRKTSPRVKRGFFYLPIICILLIINPISLYYFTRYEIELYYLIFIIPLPFVIIFVFINKTKTIEKVIILLLMFFVSKTIFTPLSPIRETSQNFYYRIDEEVLEISHYLNTQKDVKNLLVIKELLYEITVDTDHVELLYDIHDITNTAEEDLILMYYTIHDQIPFDVIFFTQQLETYHIDGIIVDKNKMVNQDLNLISTDKIEFDYYVLYLF